MKNSWIAPSFVVSAALVFAAAIVARGEGMGRNDVGHFCPLAGFDGKLDQWEGVIYMVDPNSPGDFLRIDLTKPDVKITQPQPPQGPFKWPAPQNGKAEQVPTFGRNFVQIADRMEIMDTRTGDRYALEMPKTPASKWDATKLVFTLTNFETGKKGIFK